jgi:hypothetical protein
LLNAGKALQQAFTDRIQQPIEKIVALGHNHISLNWAGQGEQWGEDEEKFPSRVKIFCVMT